MSSEKNGENPFHRKHKDSGQRSSSQGKSDPIRGMERRRWTTGRYSSTGNDCLSDGVTQEGRQAGDWLFLYKRVGWVAGKIRNL